jgi:DNA modification methylase
VARVEIPLDRLARLTSPPWEIQPWDTPKSFGCFVEHYLSLPSDKRTLLEAYRRYKTKIGRKSDKKVVNAPSTWRCWHDGLNGIGKAPPGSPYEFSLTWAQRTLLRDIDLEKAISEIREPKTKLGDIYQLGIHRLICGDTTDPEILQKLLKKEKAKMVFSDPVYNIGLSYNTGLSGNKSYGGETNDNKTDAEYKNLLRRSLENALSASESDTHVFYWCDETYIGLVQDIYRELGIENRRVCLWIKNGQNPTPKVAFNKCYEPCVYGIRGKPYLSKSDQSLNEVMNKEVGTGNRLVDDILDLMDIWLVKRLPANEYEHPTSKPPTLYQKAIRRCTKPGDIILDGFGGSGSCLIAGEQLKRKVYLVEIEPVFCDVIIKRYETLTGTKAKKLN